MKITMLYVTLSFSLMFSVTFQAGARVKLSYGETVALASANLINRHKKVGDFLRIFKPHLSRAEYKQLKKTLSSYNVSVNEKMPRAKVRGDKIILPQGQFVQIKSPERFVVNGRTFQRSKKNISSRFKQIHLEISKKNKVSFLDIVFPRAYAFGDAMGIIALMGAGFGGYYLGPKLGVKNSTGALLSVGGLYLATELWQSFKKGDVSCTSDGKYQVRSKERNMWFMAMSEKRVLSDEKVEEAGLDSVCTDANAAALKVWAETNSLTAEVEEEVVAPSTSIYGE